MSSEHSQVSVVHLIPSFGIGGVEHAASTMLADAEEEKNDFSFSVETIFDLGLPRKWYFLNNPYYYFKSAINISANRDTELLIVSLWRSCLVGLLVKILRPKIKLIVFLHSADDAHLIDKLLHRVILLFSDEVWSDSNETLRRRFSNSYIHKSRIISFVTARLAPLPAQHVKPVFIFWGRLHAQKNLWLSIDIFSVITSKYADSFFHIIGPDDGDLDKLKAQVESLKLQNSVAFHGGMNFEKIRKIAASASFYLQTSKQEGMAMSVVEAMQFGLVPIVTPVGEISDYARHGDNSIIVNNHADAIEDIISLLQNDLTYQKIRARSISTWSTHPLYRDSIISAFRDLLNLDVRSFHEKY